MKTHMKHYFLASYTGKGYVELFHEAIKSLDYVYVLKSVPGNGQTKLIKNIASYFQEKGESIDYIHRASEADKLDGLILSDQKVGIIADTPLTNGKPIVTFVTCLYVVLYIVNHAKKLVDPYKT